MTDKELIKQEIERLKQINGFLPIDNHEICDAYRARGYQLACDDIFQFIDSLPEESESGDRINECPHWEKYWGCETSPMNNCDSCPHAKWVEVKEEKKNYNERYKRFAQTEQFKKSYCDKSLGKEEPVREDLEEYAKKLAKGAALDKHNLIWMCKKGAEWQKQKDEELFSEDIWNYIEENYPNITEEEKLRLYDVSIKSRLAGADTFKKHIREEMKKDAVETTIVNDWQYGKDPDHAIIPAIHQRIKGFTVGDKVKIIVIKENKQ